MVDRFIKEEKNEMDESKENKKKSKNLHKPAMVLILFRFIFEYIGVLFPSLIGRWAYRLWFQTHRSSTIPQREQAWLKTASRIEAVTLEINAYGVGTLPVMTYYWENDTDKSKNAPLVMMVHGWTGRGSQMGAFVAPLLKEGFRVLAFDNHAHDKTPGKLTHIFLQSAVQRALDEEFGPIYAIVAHSFGGMVTPYSLNEGMKTQKVVCISPPSHFDFLLARFSKSLHLPKSIQSYMVNRFKKEYGDNLVERVSSTNTSKGLGHIPVLIIHDEDDEDVLISESEQLQQAWSNSQMIRTKGLGHRRILYNTQVIENTVNFIKSG